MPTRLRDCGIAQTLGQRPIAYRPGATPQVHTSKQPISANGAFHPFGIVRDGVMNGAWRSAGSGFQPSWCVRHDTWGVAPGWYKNAPLALTEANVTCLDSWSSRVRRSFVPKMPRMPTRLRDCGIAQTLGQRPAAYQPGATPQVHTSKQPISANGAFHPFGIVRDRLINGA